MRSLLQRKQFSPESKTQNRQVQKQEIDCCRNNPVDSFPFVYRKASHPYKRGNKSRKRAYQQILFRGLRYFARCPQKQVYQKQDKKLYFKENCSETKEVFPEVRELLFEAFLIDVTHSLHPTTFLRACTARYPSSAGNRPYSALSWCTRGSFFSGCF